VCVASLSGLNALIYTQYRQNFRACGGQASPQTPVPKPQFTPQPETPDLSWSRSAPRALGGVHCAPGVSSAASAGRGSATGLRAGSARRRARSTGARGAAGAVCTPTRGAARGVCETGYAATTGGDATAARARARRRGGCRCEQRSDRYYRFTLEGEAAPPPMPPINGLCNSRLCRPHLRP
jgi:hypothetical protein